MTKPTVEELLAFARELGMAEDYMRTDLFWTGERKPIEHDLLQRWIDEFWTDEP